MEALSIADALSQQFNYICYSIFTFHAESGEIFKAVK